jgi:hypothetical protein
LIAAKATFALNAGLWFLRGLFANSPRLAWLFISRAKLQSEILLLPPLAAVGTFTAAVPTIPQLGAR